MPTPDYGPRGCCGETALLGLAIITAVVSGLSLLIGAL